MGILEKFKRSSKKELVLSNTEMQPVENDNELQAVTNYMLADVKKDMVLSNSIAMPLSSLSNLGSCVSSLETTIKELTSDSKTSGSGLYRVTNLNIGDKLNTTKKGITYGAVKKTDGSSKLAQLKEVNSVPLDPTTMMMAVALYEIEGQLNEIIEISKKIFSFLQQDKEAEIEADLECLNNIIREFKYNWDDSQYLTNNHKYVMDIKRTAKKNMNFYKKQITDDILQNNLIVMNQKMNSIQNELEKKFKYYRLALYTYSFSSFLEIFLLGNYQGDYLITKKEELEALDEEYMNNFEIASKFIKKTANKSLEGNFLKGLGSTQKAIGDLAEKIPVMRDKQIDQMFKKNAESFKESGENIKNEFSDRFELIKKSNAEIFINKVDDINQIYNKTQSIYFDNENIYLDYSDNLK